MLIRNLLFLLAACLFTATLPCTAYAQVPPIRVEGGLVSGTANEMGNVRIYKGIPYAEPPVGDLRWMAPQPLKSWEGVMACEEFPPSAMQPLPVPFFVWSKEFMAPQEPLSEDCLYLNVWTPAVSADEKLPVFVWIHGGGFMSGAGSCPIYDGEGMARKGLVFVTINYRLGIFGFLAHPELSRESGHNASGNYAFLDQIAALRWVQQNIAAFGGDPKRVTIAGQSAGAFSVCALMASPLAKGLFQRAIAQSGGMFGDQRLKPLHRAELEGIRLAQKLNANSVGELRKMPAEELLKAATLNEPVLDGYVLPGSVDEIFRNGKQNDVPLLAGWNRDEGFVFGQALNAGEFRRQARHRYGQLADEFLRAYPAHSDNEALQSQKDLSRDQLFAWQAHYWARMQAKTGKGKAWLYRFDRVPPGRPDLAEHGAFHSAEIAYTLNTLYAWDRPWEPLDRQISGQMAGYWANFAMNGNPNGTGLPDWLHVQQGQQPVMVFGDSTSLQKETLSPGFQFLDKWQAASAIDISQYKKATYGEGRDSLPYRILFPENYDTSKQYPLVLFLHGAGERGDDNEKQLVHGATLFLKNENRKDFPAIVVFPQCPAGTYWANVKIDRSKMPFTIAFDYAGQEVTTNLRLALGLTKHLLLTEAVDTGRVYIMGLSMGGMGTFEAVWREPELFAAAMPICGGGDAMAYNEKTARLPFWIFHGADDGVVKPELSREMYARLSALGADVRYTEYPAVNHNSWDHAFAEEDFLKWLFSQKK